MPSVDRYSSPQHRLSSASEDGEVRNTKIQRRWIPITYTVERGQQSVTYPGLGDYSDWDENIFTLYGNLVRVTPSYILEAGLRIEGTQVSYTIPQENIYYPGSDAYDYFEFFPNVKLTYNLGTRSRVIAAYNRRVDRPGEPELRSLTDRASAHFTKT